MVTGMNVTNVCLLLFVIWPGLVLAQPQKQQLPKDARFIDKTELPEVKAALAEEAKRKPQRDQVVEAMQGPLAGYTLNKRLASDNPADKILLMENGGRARVLMWTTDVGKRTVRLPFSGGTVSAFASDGEPLGQFTITEAPAEVPIARDAIVYEGSQGDVLTQLALAAEALPEVRRVRGPQMVSITSRFSNPFPQDVNLLALDGTPVAIPAGRSVNVAEEVYIGRSLEPYRFVVGVVGIEQAVEITPVNPVVVELWPEFTNAVTVNLLNPDGEPFRALAEVELMNETEKDEPFAFQLEMLRGERMKTLQLPMEYTGELPFPLKLTLKVTHPDNTYERVTLAESASTRFIAAADFTKLDERNQPLLYRAREPQKGFALINVAEPRQDGLPNPDRAACVLAYEFGAPQASAAVMPAIASAQSIFADPLALGMWLYADGSGHLATVTIKDGAGQLHELSPVPLSWKGWRYHQFYLSEGWPLPLTLDALLLVKSVPGTPSSGSVFINNPVFVYTFDER